MKWATFQLLILVGLSFSLVPTEILVLILSQPDAHHSGVAKILLQSIYQQLHRLNSTSVHVKLLHEVADFPGYWSFLHSLPQLDKLGYFSANLKWVILCEDKSSVNITNLLYGLTKFDHTQVFYAGYPIYDEEATIIHHFAFFEKPQWFPYPLIRSGVALSLPLITKLSNLAHQNKPTSEFFIDASYELSLFIWKSVRATRKENGKQKSGSHLSLRQPQSCQQADIVCKNHGDASNIEPLEDYDINTKLSKQTKDHKLLMTVSPYFCRNEESYCAVYASKSRSACHSVQVEEVYFAIKTYHKFHAERIPIIEKTWGQYTAHKKYFSDISDKSIPTFTTYVPNAETGHCTKTLSIINLALQDIDRINVSISPGRRQIPVKWIFLCDDDTLLSVSRVCNILGCFNDTQYIYLGERYGYRLHSKDGFNYITGGGGMAISLSTARKIVTSCVCPAITSPDDMIIGLCLQRLGIKAIHSPGFHQARPSDYAAYLLSLDNPVTFHKFWQIDPIRVYAKWFHKADEGMRSAVVKEKKSICDIQARQSTKFNNEPSTDGLSRNQVHHSEL